MEKEITINREWLERLIELQDNVKCSGGQEKESWIHHLLGCIETAEYFLEKK